MLYAFLLPAVVLALLFVPVVVAIKKKKGEKSIKKAFAANICSFFAVMLICAALPLGMKASAESEAAAPVTAVAEEAEAEEENSDTSGLLYIASALAVGLGAIGGGIAIAAAAPAAIGAVSENPKTFSNALIFAALGEACALYGFVVALLMLFI
ncbi:MAG: ATPase [Oscillospiraceae bacterium]